MLRLRLPGGAPSQLYVPLARAVRPRARPAADRHALAPADNWGKKAIGRKTTGTGRCRYLKDMPRKFKNGFREGERPACRARPSVGALDHLKP